MAKFFGKVGYVLTTEISPGVWMPLTSSREYYGDMVRNSRNWSQGESTNDDLSLGNEVSILADPFAFENLSAMKWVEFLGNKWRINGVDVNYPRITIRFGGVYNATDEETGTPSDPSGSIG